MKPIRVVMVDDSSISRMVLNAVIGLEDDIEIVGEAANGVEVVDLAISMVPDVVLMDVRMPVLDGIAACSQIKAAVPSAKILMLTVSDEESDLFEALRAGASGYLLKDEPAEGVAESVRAVLAGHSMIPPRLAAQLIAEFGPTMIILIFGSGVCAMVALFGSGVPGEVVKGGYTNITFGWALGVTFGVWATARISGAHLNPAVTLALAVFRGFRWTHVLPFIVAQTAGGFAGAALVFANYRAAFQQFDPVLEKTAGIFTTFPAFPAQPSLGAMSLRTVVWLLLFLVLARLARKGSAR